MVGDLSVVILMNWNIFKHLLQGTWKNCLTD